MTQKKRPKASASKPWNAAARAPDQARLPVFICAKARPECAQECMHCRPHMRRPSCAASALSRCNDTGDLCHCIILQA
jgi:hypothetical protein